MIQALITYRTASPADTLNRLEKAGIGIYNLQQAEEYLLHFQIRGRDRRALSEIAEKYGDEITHVQAAKASLSCKHIWKRPFLIGGILLLLFLTFWVPSRIFFIQITGNTHVSSATILQVLEEYGIQFGTPRRNIQSSELKTILLSAIPELQWAGFNTNGCVATITIREREEQNHTQTQTGIHSIVAAIDGVVGNITVLTGHGLCQPGDAVKAGQLLISPYEDLGIRIRITQAKGEVYAYTTRHFSAVSPTKWSKKATVRRTETKYYLFFGKKRINFYNNSGILDTTCAKIYEQRFITLPGGFSLPIVIGKETCIYYSDEVDQYDDIATHMSKFASVSLQKMMIAGTVLYTTEKYIQDEELYRICGVYGCYEMISRLRTEECLP